MNKYEYKVVKDLVEQSNYTGGRNETGVDSMTQKLNEIGSDGWEMCGHTGTTRCIGGFIFKREIKSK